MAGDWIKVEKLTPDKPELMAVARECGCTPGDAFAAWFRLWAYFDSATEDGTVRFMSASDADRLGTLSGLGAAMERTGWLTFDADGCHVAKWSRHNGQSAKRRAVDAERKRQQRKAGIDALREAAERPKNVRIESGRDADEKRIDCGPEKRREEKIETPLTPKGAVEPLIESEDPEGKAALVHAQPLIEDPWTRLADPEVIQSIIRRLTAADATPAYLSAWRAAVRELAARDADFEAVKDAVNQRCYDEQPKYAPKLPQANRLNAQWFLSLVQHYDTSGDRHG